MTLEDVVKMFASLNGQPIVHYLFGRFDEHSVNQKEVHFNENQSKRKRNQIKITK